MVIQEDWLVTSVHHIGTCKLLVDGELRIDPHRFFSLLISWPLGGVNHPGGAVLSNTYPLRKQPAAHPERCNDLGLEKTFFVTVSPWPGPEAQPHGCLLQPGFKRVKSVGRCFQGIWTFLKIQTMNPKGCVLILGGFAGVPKTATKRRNVINGFLYLGEKSSPFVR